MRDSHGDIPLNVLTLGFPVTDTRKPRITCLGIYSLDPQSRVADSATKIIIPLKSSNGDRITIPDPVRVWGNIGFGIETYDYLDGRENICSPLLVSLQVDDKPVSSFTLDRIPFEKTSLGEQPYRLCGEDRSADGKYKNCSSIRTINWTSIPASSTAESAASPIHSTTRWLFALRMPQGTSRFVHFRVISEASCMGHRKQHRIPTGWQHFITTA